MKKVTSLIVLILTIFVSSESILGITINPFFFPIYRYSLISTDKDDNPHRRPTPFQCAISRNEGVKISSITGEEIERYEIYDTSGVCLGIFSDEDQFVSSLFSRSGVFEVRFYTSDYLFIGEIEI